jgi:hypothetical protein
MLRRRVTHLLARPATTARRRHGDEDCEQERTLGQAESQGRQGNPSLTPSEKASAKRSAKKAGVRIRTSSTTCTRPARGRRSEHRGVWRAARCAQERAGQEPKPAPTKDPKGGLTAAGRKAFAKSEGAHLKRA